LDQRFPWIVEVQLYAFDILACANRQQKSPARTGTVQNGE
jgi:hypothetical protein